MNKQTERSTGSGVGPAKSSMPVEIKTIEQIREEARQNIQQRLSQNQESKSKPFEYKEVDNDKLSIPNFNLKPAK